MDSLPHPKAVLWVNGAACCHCTQPQPAIQQRHFIKWRKRWIWIKILYVWMLYYILLHYMQRTKIISKGKSKLLKCVRGDVSKSLKCSVTASKSAPLQQARVSQKPNLAEKRCWQAHRMLGRHWPAPVSSQSAPAGQGVLQRPRDAHSLWGHSRWPPAPVFPPQPCQTSLPELQSFSGTRNCKLDMVQLL